MLLSMFKREEKDSNEFKKKEMNLVGKPLGKMRSGA